MRKTLALLSLATLTLTACGAVPEANPDRDASASPAATQSQKPSKQDGPPPVVVPSKTSKPETSIPSGVGAVLDGPLAIDVLATLPVKGKAPATGYARNEKFGNGWKDFDGDKCDERQDTLARDMVNVKFKDSRRCTVASGTLNDLYTGKTINWKTKAGSIDIDHAVALKNTWISGAQQLSHEQRRALANDPLNLISSDASANRQKGDKNAAEWLPSYKPFRCQYVATQISVKKKYALSVTAPEKDAMARVLDGCKEQKAAKVTPIKPAGDSQAVAPAPTEDKDSDKASGPATGNLVHPGSFCSEAGAKGVGRKNGNPYTCKMDDNGKLRWRA